MAKTLRERFEDLDRRIADLDGRRGQATPEEHDVAELFADLRGRHERMRGYLDPNRGTGATWASSKDAPEGGGGPSPADVPGHGTAADPSNTGGRQPEREVQEDYPLHSTIADDAEAEKEMDALERAFDQARTRFR